MFLHEPRRDNESKYCILWCHRNAPNLQINWSHRITNKTLEDFIILASSGSLRIQILRPKKKKSWAQTFQFFCFRNHKKSLFYQRQKKLFSLPVWHTTELLLSPPTFSLSLSLTHTHTHTHTHTREGIHEQGPWEDTAILWTQDPDQINIWNIDPYYGNWWK